MKSSNKIKLANLVSYTWILVIIIAGTMEYAKYYQGNILSAFFSTLRLFTLSIDIPLDQVSLILWLIAFMAVMATATVIIRILISFRSYLIVIMWKNRKDAVAIHTDMDDGIEGLWKQNNRNCKITDHRLSFQARRQFIYYSTSIKMIDFIKQYSEYIEADEKHQYYLCCHDWDNDLFEHDEVHSVNLSENCARIYWNEYPVLDPNETIVIIGFGYYAQAILTQALINNVISVTSNFTYHIFPIEQKEIDLLHDFISIHHELGQFISIDEKQEGRDCIIIHKDSIYQCLSRLNANRVLVVTDWDEVNINIISNLKQYFTCENIHVRISNQEVINMLFEKADMKSGKQMIPFGQKEIIMSYEIVFNESLQKKAKMIDANYRLHNMKDTLSDYCKEMTAIELIETKEFLNEWNQMNYFTKYSNILQADHMNYKIRLLLGNQKLDADPKKRELQLQTAWDSKSQQEKEVLAEIEHIRWCRYHYMNNWIYGEQRDKKHKIHNYLCPYNQLDEQIKQMDQDTYHGLAEYLDD